MKKKQLGEVRRSQLITTYGVGAVIAVKNESFVVVGIDEWPVTRPNLHEPRLERELRVEGFVTPPATDDGPDIPVRRFPRWVFCPTCGRLDEHSWFSGAARNQCQKCGDDLVPSRFVVCCSNGHLDDFPYFPWVHAGHPRQGTKHVMSIESAGRTASLRDIRIMCSCGLDRTMEGAFRESALRSKCKGGRPWLSSNEEGCDETPRVLQRGASNVWFSIVQSALSIPPWSEGVYKVINKQWPTLRHIPGEALAPTIAGMGLAEGSAFSVEDLVVAVLERRQRDSSEEEPTAANLRREEHKALSRGRPETSKEQDFVCVPASVPELASRWFSQVMLVPRLREVRALQSFARLQPPAGAPRRELPPVFDSDPGWLPAIEVRGEGVFMELDPAKVQKWERQSAVANRVAVVDRNYRRRFEVNDQKPDRTITPRFVLAHTIAHALINQWSLDCGYPNAALRERLFVDEETAGILIYTATSDSAGSLGGVVAQAGPERFDANLASAIAAAAWCSADPLCMEADAAGVDALNLAACHACMLLPEVSCEERNMLLDRALLVGTPNAAEVGFFSDLL